MTNALRVRPGFPSLPGMLISSLLLLAQVICVFGQLDKPSSRALSAAALFEANRVLELQVEISPDGLASLRQDRRKSVSAVVREGSTVYSNVSVHLKGTRGSLRSVDDKPSFTLQFEGASPADRFHGLTKIHLNNSVEDPSYLNQAIGSHLFHEASIPAPRTAYATVRLVQRELGIYVLQEGLTEAFFSERYPGSQLMLFEPGRGQDVDQVLAPKWGDVTGLSPPFARLAQAVRPQAGNPRWNQLSEVVDLDRFITFMAMEVILGHRDGYCLARNNFRLLFDSQRQKFLFMPYGMDQLLGSPRAAWAPDMAGLVAQAVMRTPEGRAAYRERCGHLITNVFQPERLIGFIRAQAQGLEPWLSRQARNSFRREVLELERRVQERRSSLDKQLAEPERRPLVFLNGEARLVDWLPRDVPEGGRLEVLNVSDGRETLHILAGPKTAASWRSPVQLFPGRYRLVGQVRTAAVRPLPFGSRQGAALRVADLPLTAVPTLVGDSSWTPLSVEFEVMGELRVLEMACELRASGGEAWFALNSLRLMKLP